MTFSEADSQYTLVKKQHLAGILSDQQFDEQLRSMMVLDDLGRWWAKSRENGAWHYYDALTEIWVTGAPPSAAPPTPPSSLPVQAAAQPPQYNSAGGAESPASATQSALPKWAAAKPAAGDAAPVSSATGAWPRADPLPSTAQGAPATAAQRPNAFGPIPELSSGMKILLYIFSLLVPILGVVLFFVYRHKPAAADRTAARAFLILGIASLVFSGMCITTFYLLEAAVANAIF